MEEGPNAAVHSSESCLRGAGSRDARSANSTLIFEVNSSRFRKRLRERSERHRKKSSPIPCKIHELHQEFRTTDRPWVSHGRKVALDCLNAALNAADTFQGTWPTCRFREGTAPVGAGVLIYPSGAHLRVGAGKGTFPIAFALDRIWGKGSPRGSCWSRRRDRKS